MRNYDLVFLKKFSMLIGFLVFLMLSLILAALYINGSLPTERDPLMQHLTEERIAPVGAVYAGQTGAAQQAAASAAAAAAAASQVAYGGTKDGSVIFGQLCSGCHASGAGGAPTLDHAHWDARIAKGKDTLYDHAIHGFQGAAGVMPAKGGNPALTDDQVKATVDWITSNIK
ncbi:c-type cytochrome [Cognatilysobacter lacus]|uniref:Cytochrome c5 family protein n=1 Tax=Cognatilysobacter lacus TaxID=1643323 RepID=A0A5D8Z789_9GAMM|nr:c-type cytochrome [Lysobacter lacus]TZF90649.1 cytochrome c5 family protein [Lysobacter lacus]